MKKTLLAAMLGICVASSAQAKTFTNADAADEADEHLTISCTTLPNLSECQSSAKRFTEEYQNAYAGDYLAQTNIAYDLWKGVYPDDNSSPVLASQIDACAWITVALQSRSPYKRDTDQDLHRYICTGPAHPNSSTPPHLTPSTPAVRERIQAIRRIIRAHTVHPVSVEEIGYDANRDANESCNGEGNKRK